MSTSKILVTILVAFFAYKAYNYANYTKEPPVLKSQWWGAGMAIENISTSIRKIEIKVPDALIKDLNQRLQNTR